MLAEYLGSRGYATAGFVANTGYCSYDTGLAVVLPTTKITRSRNLAFLRTAVFVKEILRRMFELGYADRIRSPAIPCQNSLSVGFTPALAKTRDRSIARFSTGSPAGRGNASVLRVSELHRRPCAVQAAGWSATPLRPQAREADDEIRVIYEGWDLIDKLKLPKHYLTMARDAYDNCLAYLDEQLGVLFDELEHRGLLDDTLVVITSDHGEGLGEHDLFDHGESLYSTELDVPLLILLPRASRTARVVPRSRESS